MILHINFISSHFDSKPGNNGPYLKCNTWPVQGRKEMYQAFPKEAMLDCMFTG